MLKQGSQTFNYNDSILANKNELWHGHHNKNVYGYSVESTIQNLPERQNTNYSKTMNFSNTMKPGSNLEKPGSVPL